MLGCIECRRTREGRQLLSRTHDSHSIHTVPITATHATSHAHDQAHVAMTYVALALLLMLGDDFSRVNKKAVINSLKFLRTEQGGITCIASGSESDMRYIYCACCVSYMLKDWSGIDREKICHYIIKSQSFDYACAQEPGAESHGGSTYCAVASLSLMGMLDRLPHKSQIVKWLANRQIMGFQGRANKLQDTCYSFWIGSTLKILGTFDEVVNFSNTRSFTLSCQHKYGGFSKAQDAYPDVLHSYFSLCGLGYIREPGISEINPELGFSQRAVDRLKDIH